jgi:WhiB family transcriptional regulator, redox-sensing transcriptional regulator
MSTTTTKPMDDWRDQAACFGQDTALFFPESDDEAAPALAVCAVCPVRDECREWAIAARQDDGVWGGMTGQQRVRLRRQRQAAARRHRAA